MPKPGRSKPSRNPRVTDPFDRDSADLLWQELDVDEYHIWLRSGLHYDRWEYGFQHRPPGGPHGPMDGPIFLQQPPRLPGDFDAVKDLALEAIRVDGLRRLTSEN